MKWMLWKDRPLFFFLICSIGFKVISIPGYFSTDFEVHRNWLSITSSLPTNLWYYEATSEWTLDYPPFFAWFEYFLSLFASFFDKNMLKISKIPYFSIETLYFQHISVILMDCLIFFPALMLYCNFWPSKTVIESEFSYLKRFTIIVLTFMDPGLFMVDHLHFQYNAMLLGILIASIACIRHGNDLLAAILYASLLMMKHIYLYSALVYFTYLLRHFCFQPKLQITQVKAKKHKESSSTHDRSDLKSQKRKRSLSNSDLHPILSKEKSFSFTRLMLLGSLVLCIFLFAFFSVSSLTTWKQDLFQILSRLFPIQRGLCHAYWAPNLWALYAFIDKMLSFLLLPNQIRGNMSNGLVQEHTFLILPTITPFYCVICTFFFMLPMLFKLWKLPSPSFFLYGIIYAMMCSFLTGYHVHEKAILQVTIPFALVMGDSIFDANIYRFLSLIANISLFPLFYTPMERFIVMLLTALHSLFTYVLLSYYMQYSFKQKYLQWNETLLSFSTIQKGYLTILICQQLFAFGFPIVGGNYAIRFPFIPLMTTSVTCAIGILYSFILIYQQILRKEKAIKAYADDGHVSSHVKNPSKQANRFDIF